MLVRVDACGLNPVDAKIIYWKKTAPDMNDHWVPGLDVSGTIAAVGSRVADWTVGDRVLYHGNMLRPHGGFAEYAVHRAATLVAHPAVSATDAAATPCAGWTAWRGLVDRLRITPDDTLLIGGGSGGVGGFAVQIAKAIGVRTIVATCSAKNRDYVKSLGATHLIDYRTEDIVQRVQEITDGRGVTRALDTVGGDNDIPLANALCYEGELVEIAGLARPKEYEQAFERSLTFHQLAFGGAHGRTDTEQRITQAGIECSRRLESGDIQVPRKRIITLEETGAALKELLSGRTVGKVVMENA